MSVSNCGHDEYYRYANGNAGDQTGTEWEIRNWYRYDGGWSHVIRFEDERVAALIAQYATAAAMNDCIGYDQNQRYTFWEQLKNVGYNPANIRVRCESDCSAGVAAIVKAVGYTLGIPALKKVSIYDYTGSIREDLKAAGAKVFTDSKYLESDAYLKKGDIVLKEFHHVMINLTNGAKAQTTTPVAPTPSPAPAPVTKDVNVEYCVYTKKYGWLPIVKNLEDYAGLSNNPILGFAAKVNVGRLKYQVHTIGYGWHNWIWGENFDLKNVETGFAGNLEREIDAIRCYYYTPDDVRPYKYAMYRVDTTDRNSYFDWQRDDETSDGQDGYAGDFGRPIDRVQLCIQ